MASVLLMVDTGVHLTSEMEMTKYTVKAVPRNLIEVDPYLTPECMEVRHFISVRQKRVDQFIQLLSDFGFQDPLKVFYRQGKHYLLDDYDYFKALETLHATNPEQEVYCIVAVVDDYHYAKKLSLRLQSLRGLETQEARLINLKCLVEAKCSYEEIKNIYGVRKAKSAEGKQLWRDHRLVKCDPLFSRVLGTPPETEDSPIFDRIHRPHVRTSTLSYRFALELISLLNADPSLIAEFDRRYEEHLSELKEHHLLEDESTKPIHTWSKYNQSFVRSLAAAIGRGGARTSYDRAILNGDPETLDQKWAVQVNDKTFEMVLPNIKVNLAKKADSNIKKIVELHYKIERLHHSLGSYLKRINPVDHGERIRTRNSDIAPSFDTMSNAPKFEDPSYFEAIRRHKNLYYCDRELLLKSIGLKAHFFNFDSYAPNSVSSYEKAYQKFNKWYSESFLKRIEIYERGQAKKHRYFEIYESIKRYLAFRSGDNGDVLFADFVLEVFKKVFSDLDLAYEKRQLELEELRKVDLDLKNSTLGKISEALKKVGISEEDLLVAAKELIRPDEDRLISHISKLENTVQRYTTLVDEGGE